jgi:hypothetical protein
VLLDLAAQFASHITGRFHERRQLVNRPLIVGDVRDLETSFEL